MRSFTNDTSSSPANSFWADEEASMSIEAAIILPLLCFLFVAGYVYFDGYRRDATMSKATYAVADLLSRRRDVIELADLEGLENIYEKIVFSTEAHSYMRFTEILKDGDGLEITWTRATDDPEDINGMTPEELDRIKGRIPRFDDGTRLLLVEAYTYDHPIFNVFLPDRVVDTFQLISARYESCIVYSEDGTDPGGCVLGGGSGDGDGTQDDEGDNPFGPPASDPFDAG